MKDYFPAMSFDESVTASYDASAIRGDEKETVAFLFANVRLDIARFDPVTQVLEETHVKLSSAGAQLNPIVTRYAWHTELDLMARIAGLQLRERWATWTREPFSGTRGNCISVYERRVR